MQEGTSQLERILLARKGKARSANSPALWDTGLRSCFSFTSTKLAKLRCIESLRTRKKSRGYQKQRFSGNDCLSQWSVLQPNPADFTTKETKGTAQPPRNPCRFHQLPFHRYSWLLIPVAKASLYCPSIPAPASVWESKPAQGLCSCGNTRCQAIPLWLTLSATCLIKGSSFSCSQVCNWSIPQCTCRGGTV